MLGYPGPQPGCPPPPNPPESCPPPPPPPFRVPGIGRVAGYGIFSSDLLSISAYVPVHLRQTNNTAELFAVLRAIQLLPPGRYACSDSSYVILGASGAARRSKLRGWTGSSGPVSNVEIWEQLLCELS